jgi:hypothetical protein
MIQTDTRSLNWSYLYIDFLSIGVDGNRIKSCVSPPDPTLNSLLKQYGSDLYRTALVCADWADSNGQSGTGACLTWIGYPERSHCRIVLQIRLKRICKWCAGCGSTYS